MGNDLDVKGSFDGLDMIISDIKVDEMKTGEASQIIKTLREIDEVFKVVF
jgi:hypothetical protein